MSEPISALVAQHPFLRGLDAEHLAAIAATAREVRFKKGALLLREGDAATASYLIVSGRVSLEVRSASQAHTVATIDEGEVVGWSWLVPPSKWHFDARATSAVHAVLIDGEQLLEACDTYPPLGYALMKRFLRVVTQRLEAVRLQLLDLYAPHGSELPWA